MKRFVALIILLPLSCLVYANAGCKADTVGKATGRVIEAEYPGGVEAFNSFIARNLHYPDAARLMCVNGKVYVSFTIGTDGKVTNVTAINCLGAGCESEAVRVVQRSRRWKPAISNGKPMQGSYVIPINFYMETRKVYMENLITSGYSFVFKINGDLYSVDDAERIMGKAFNPDKIEITEPYYDQAAGRKLSRSRKKKPILSQLNHYEIKDYLRLTHCCYCFWLQTTFANTTNARSPWQSKP